MGWVSGDIGIRVEVPRSDCLGVGDLGGFGLGGEEVFSKSNGLKGKKLLNVRTGLW